MRYWLVVVVAAVVALAVPACFKVKQKPSAREVLEPPVRFAAPAYDVWGRAVSHEEARRLMGTAGGQAMLSPENGAVRIDRKLLELGEKEYYEQTFGNEIFLTDILGILDGPMTEGSFVEAIAKLGGKGTTDLVVELSKDAVIGGRRFRKGEKVHTGIDVPRGSIAALGMTVHVIGGKPYAGITCAVCHSTVDPRTMDVVHGAPNADFRAGVLIAMGTNSASYFSHTDVDPRNFVKRIEGKPRREVTSSLGNRVALPDVVELEQAVDAVLLKWPPGTFDSNLNLVSDPTDYSHCFTRAHKVFQWSGSFAVGPFRGLAAQVNNVHALNSDPFGNTDQMGSLHGIDREFYLAVMLQNAAVKKFRYDPAGGVRPSEFWGKVDPTPTSIAVNQAVNLTTYPNPSLFSFVGQVISSPGAPFCEQINAISAWQDTLYPPDAPVEADEVMRELGRRVFERANCGSCHSGPFLTNDEIIPVEKIGTEPARAVALRGVAPHLVPSEVYSFAEMTPLPERPKVVKVPETVSRRAVELAFGVPPTNGGYRVSALVGLYWTPPYFHDSSVVVGANPETDVGLPGTVMRHVRADAFQSLRAVVDRQLRRRVVAANEGHPDLPTTHTSGRGHEYWVDREAGFSEEEQRALLLYLLAYRPPVE